MLATAEVEVVLGVVGLVHDRGPSVDAKGRRATDQTRTVAVVVVGGVVVRMTTSRHRLVGALVLGRRRQRWEASMIGMVKRMDVGQKRKGNVEGKNKLLKVECDNDIGEFFVRVFSLCLFIGVFIG